MSSKDNEQSVNIFNLLEEASEDQENAPKSRRTELLESIGVKECFKEGNLKIDMRTCRGIECNLCVKACPTNALYWKAGEIGIVEDLCIYCTACVTNCMVDDCIHVNRMRQDGKTESFSNPKDVLNIQQNICSKKRRDKVKARYPTVDAYFKRHNANK